MDNRELKDKHFAALRNKYQIGLYRSVAFDGFLYLILRKAELGIQITSLESQWLTENRLFKTIETISSVQQYQAEEFTRFEEECSSLRVKYKIPEDFKLSVDSLVYSILWKLETGKLLTDSELGLIKRFNLKDTIGLIEDILSFSKLKTNYKATQHGEDFPEEPLYSILQKIDNKELLSEDETNWLLDHGFQGTL